MDTKIADFERLTQNAFENGLKPQKINTESGEKVIDIRTGVNEVLAKAEEYEKQLREKQMQKNKSKEDIIK